MQHRTPQVEADAGGARLREKRPTFRRQHRHVADVKFWPVEAPARIHALEADVQVRSLIDPGLDLITVFRQVRDRDAHCADQQREQDDEGTRNTASQRMTRRAAGRSGDSGFGVWARNLESHQHHVELVHGIERLGLQADRLARQGLELGE